MKISNTTVSKIGHYTIVEIMMVIAIFMIILSMAMAAWLSSGNQARLRNSVRLVTAQLNLARAKAVAERTYVGVYFSNNGAANATKTDPDADGNPYPGSSACRLYYFDQPTGKRVGFVDSAEWEVLPGGTSFVFPDEIEQPSGTLTKTTAYVVFDRRGRIVANSSNIKTVDGSNGSFYGIALVEGTPGQKIAENLPYYISTINKHSGRVNTKFYETE